MKIRPINNTVIIAVDPKPEKSAGGIVLPYNLSLPYATGTVMAVGRGILLMTGEVKPTQCRPGDRVMIANDLAEIKRIDYDGQNCVCLPDETMIIGILEGEEGAPGLIKGA